MKCRRAQHLLFDFVDGLGNEALRAELDFHLGECPECERFALELTRSLALIKRTPAQPLDENFNWKVRLAIHRERNAIRAGGVSPGAWARAWSFRYVVSAGVAFAAVLAVGVGVMDRLEPGLSSVGEAVMMPAKSASIAQPSSESVGDRVVREHPLLPSMQSTGLGRLVSDGGSPFVSGSGAPVGAIDPSRSDAAIDSLIDLQLQQFPPDHRARLEMRLLHRLQSRLQQSQQAVPARP
jgi:anti-sigma factor RsiW